MSRISPEWEAVRNTAGAGSTPERDSTRGTVLTLWTDVHGPLSCLPSPRCDEFPPRVRSERCTQAEERR
jgi:hypothetical protein